MNSTYGNIAGTAVPTRTAPRGRYVAPAPTPRKRRSCGSSFASADASVAAPAHPRSRSRFMRYADDSQLIRSLYPLTVGPGRTLCIVVFIAVALLALYGPVCNLYANHRTNEIRASQLELQNQYVSTLSDSVKSLLSEDGIKETANARYGWTENGDRAINIIEPDGSTTKSDKDASTKSKKSNVPTTPQELKKAQAEVAAEAPWYTRMLDGVFGYKAPVD